MELRTLELLKSGSSLYRQSYRDFSEVRTIGEPIEVTQDLVNNPHKISYEAYDTFDNLDLILIYNGIFDPYDIPLGKLLDVPLASDMIAIMDTDINETEKETKQTDSINATKSNKVIKKDGGRLIYSS